MSRKRKPRFATDATQDFFKTRDPQNRVKSDIVVAFFKAYASIILRKAAAINYVDLFAGRGYYDKCSEHIGATGPYDSTPLRILDAISAGSNLLGRVRVWLNEGDRDYFKDLREAIRQSEIRSKIDPKLTNEEVSERLWSDFFARRPVEPTFFFIDPFGYIGLTRALLRAALKDWGCDVAFFFNYDRVNRSITEPLFDSHMEALFGDAHLSAVRRQLSTFGDAEVRERAIMRTLEASLADVGATHTITYRFRTMTGKTSHHLVYASKNLTGYGAMKSKMVQFSVESPEGIPYLEFLPVVLEPNQLSFLTPAELGPPRHFPHSIQRLCTDLTRCFIRETLSLEDAYDRHNVGTPYVLKNYRKAVLALHGLGKVRLIDPETGVPPRATTCPPATRITFL